MWKQWHNWEQTNWIKTALDVCADVNKVQLRQDQWLIPDRLGIENWPEAFLAQICYFEEQLVREEHDPH